MQHARANGFLFYFVKYIGLKFSHECTKHALAFSLKECPWSQTQRTHTLTHSEHTLSQKIQIYRKRKNTHALQTNPRTSLVQAHRRARTRVNYNLKLSYFLNENCVPACSLLQITLPLFFHSELALTGFDSQTFPKAHSGGAWQNPHRIVGGARARRRAPEGGCVSLIRFSFGKGSVLTHAFVIWSLSRSEAFSSLTQSKVVDDFFF